MTAYLMNVQDILLYEILKSVAVDTGIITFIRAGTPQDTDQRITLCLNLGWSSGMSTTARYWKRGYNEGEWFTMRIVLMKWNLKNFLK